MSTIEKISRLEDSLQQRLKQNIHYEQNHQRWEKQLDKASKVSTVYAVWRSLEETIFDKIPDHGLSIAPICPITNKHIYHPCYIRGRNSQYPYFEKAAISAWGTLFCGDSLTVKNAYFPFWDDLLSKDKFELSNIIEDTALFEKIQKALDSEMDNLLTQFNTNCSELGDIKIVEEKKG